MEKTPTPYPRFGYQSILILIGTFILVVGCAETRNLEQYSSAESSRENITLNIWWEKGFNLEEDEAFSAVVNNWSQKTNYKTKLSFYTTSELSEKAERAVQGSKLPDIMMSRKAEVTLYPRLAWQGKLADVSDLIEPVQDLYEENALEAVTYYNQVKNQHGFYGVPLYQTSFHIFYWQKLLASIDYTPKDIPQDWDNFWQFWQQAQDQLRAKKSDNIYGLGLPLSNASMDTFFLFEQVLEAYDITLLDSEGQLLIDKPQVRQKIIKCLDWYNQFYQQGYIPPDAIDWLNTDNNRNLLNRFVLMTPNATLSIPASVRQDQDTYYNKLGIVNFPRKPSGEPMRYVVSIKQAIIFADSPHQQIAKEFLRYLIQPEIIAEYLQASGNRYLPVHKSVWKKSSWQQTTDPYIATATKALTQSPTRLIYEAKNPAYSQVLQENIWGQALTSMIIEGLTAEQAADRAITRIKQIFAEWKSQDLSR